MATVRKIKEVESMECRGRYNKELLDCKYELTLDKFYDSWSPFNGTDINTRNKENKLEKVKKLPYCKDCCDKLYNEYRNQKRSPEEALYYVCSLNNVPFIAEKVEATFDYVEKQAKNGIMVKKIFGIYYDKLNKESSKHHMWLDFSNTDIDFKDIATHIEKRDVQKKEMEQLELDWGKQELPKDYSFLEEVFGKYTKGVEFINAQQEDLYRDLCQDRLILRKINDGRYSGEDTIDKVQSRISKTMTKLKVDDFETNKPKSPSEQSFFAKIAQIEQTKPADLYKEPKKYKDFNKFRQYEKDLILRPLGNTLAGHRDFDISIDDIERYELRE